MREADDTDGQGPFSSEIIDISDFDLSEIAELPSPVLHAAIKRVCAELAGDLEATAYFQSSLRGRQPWGGKPRNSTPLPWTAMTVARTAARALAERATLKRNGLTGYCARANRWATEGGPR